MVKLLLSTLLVFSILGCSSSPKIVTTPYSRQVELVVSGDVNPYGVGDSHPVVVRIYQLTEAGRFKSADFLALYSNDRDVLGGALVDVLSLDPIAEGTHNIALDIQRNSRYLAVFVEFANYSEAKSKAVMALNEDSEELLISIGLKGISVGVSQRETKSWWNIF